MREAAYTMFWTCLLVLAYAYIGYPLLMYVLTRFKRIRKDQVQRSALPVTLIVPAFNEAAILEEKIRNTLALNYDKALLNIIFITDGSTDGSPDIVRRFPNLGLLHEPARKGKLAAMDRAMREVRTPIAVFSDANTWLHPDSLRELVKHYADERVGGVAGEKRVRTGTEGSVAEGEGLYWKYESALKRLDARLYTVVGAAGELFSIRTSLYTPLPANTIIEDFVQSLLVCKGGYRVAYEPMAYSIERASLSLRDEWERKVRISAGAFQAMGMLKALFNFFRFPVVCFQLVSHRILRWTACPLALPLLLLSSLLLSADGAGLFYTLAFAGQLLAYSAACIAWLAVRQGRKLPGLYFLFYFVFMHLCVYEGFRRFLAGRQHVIWKKASRAKEI